MLIHKGVLVYINGPPTRFRWIAHVTTAQVCFIGLNILFLPTERTTDHLRSKAPDAKPIVCEDGPSLWEKIKKLDYKEIFSVNNFVRNFTDRPFLCSGLVTASGLISAALIMYARRSAHKITLLPNERVRFTSFSPLGVGRPPTFELPLKDVSCVVPRNEDRPHSILKLRGFIGYHLVNKNEGKFLEPKLYDEYLGYSRSWTDK